jgi:hypothetical protein
MILLVMITVNKEGKKKTDITVIRQNPAIIKGSGLTPLTTPAKKPCALLKLANAQETSDM